jgi:hypothetical protein
MAPSHRFASRSLRGAFAAATAALLAATIAAPGLAAPPGPAVIPLPDGWRPEGITTGPGTLAYVGSIAGGGVYQVDVRTGDGGVISGTEGTVGIGTFYEADANRIWVAGGPTQLVTVFDATTGATLETYDVGHPGFLNDVTVTADAAYVTDSATDHIDVIPIGPDDSLSDSSDVFQLTLGGDFTFQPGFNLNGIVAARGWLIAVQTNTATLFRIDPETGVATAIDLGAGVDVTAGDGLEVHGRTLYVVQNQLNRVAVFTLGAGLTSATLEGFLTATGPGGLDVPTTVAFVAGGLYAANARFNTPPTPDTEYWVTRLR